MGFLGYDWRPLVNTEATMSRRKKDPLRLLTDPERRALTQLSRSQAAPAVQVARASMLLAVADGSDYQRAARSAGRRSGDAVSHLVARFNAEGLTALTPRHGGGRSREDDHAARERVLREVRRQPTPEADGTATWSLSAPRKSLRSAPDGLPGVATSTIWQVLHESGHSYQQSRTWCPTGSSLRKRKSGTVVVTDPDAEAKKS
jgi:transposase